ncbi:MAG: spore cortex biosynthesis protein YabQ [Lachnospiraceae bacterium]|nr:spore cortex biosynthesis protein YabQ [Lachnospiraceae bacterium]
MFLYDTILLLRKVIPTGKLLAFLEEFILVVYLGKNTFSFMYSYTGGRVRWYMVIGFFMGMFIFQKLVSQYYLKYVEKFFMMFLSGGWIRHGK